MSFLGHRNSERATVPEVMSRRIGHRKLKLAALSLFGLSWLAGTGPLANSLSVEEGSVIKLDVNGRRGVVFFNHKSHEGLLHPGQDARHKAKPGASCSGCHHTTSPTGVPQLWKCNLCHRNEGDPANPKNSDYDDLNRERAFHDKCIGCHRATNAVSGSHKAPATCGECHRAKL